MQTEPLKPAPSEAWSPSCAARIIARGISRRPFAALSAAMATFGVDTRHPIALEWAKDERGVASLVRATDGATLAHLTREVQALYPQTEVRPCAGEDDPLRLERDEAATVVEMAARGQPYLSLRTPDARSFAKDETVGDDPLLAVVGALQGLPEGFRAVAQLALVPAPPRWSRRFQRFAVEHPLEPERARERRVASSARGRAAPSLFAIVTLAIVVVLALVWRRFGTLLAPHIPVWLKRDLPLLIRGHMPPLTPPQILQLALALGGLFLIVFAVSRLWLRVRGSTPLYDMRQVGEKTQRVAYRARVRLYVIGPVARVLLLPDEQSRPARIVRSARARRAETRQRRAIAVRLASAYRQFDSPTGTVLVPRPRHLRRAHLVARVVSWQEGFRARRLARFHRRASGALRRAERRRRRAFNRRAFGLWASSALQWLVLGRARWERGVRSSPLYLSVDEVAALWHLLAEQDAPDVAGLERGLARTRPLPPTLATASPGEVLPYRLGECHHAGQRWSVAVPRAVLHQNSLAVAATGKGKSTLFAHLALAHLAGNADDGLFFMEPHGDTIAALLSRLPPSRAEQVTLIDLADETAIVGLNPLDMTQGRSRDKTVENILAVFIAFWQKQHSWGPRTENILQFALLALAEANLRRIERDGDDLGAEGQYTLLDVIPLLQHSGFRQMVLEEVRDPVVLDWWKNYYNPLRQSFRDEMISSIINKISKYAAAKVSRRILGQSRATVRLADDIQAGRAILVNTASGVVGEEVSALVGATLVGLFQTALAEQIRVPREERRRFWVVIDEFQTYLGINYNAMLAELRKYGGAFALATQSLSYLDEIDRSLKPTVLSNSDHLFAFAMSAEDARTLAPYLDGLEVGDLLTLDAYTCYARLTHQGRRLPAFSLRIAPPPTSDEGRAATIRQHSNARHARAVSLVDEEVAPEPPPVEDTDAAFWADDGAAGMMGTPDTIKDAQAQVEPVHRRGGRGGRGTPRANGERMRRAADGTPLSQPYVVMDSARTQPRTRVWSREDPEREEGGERGGE